MDPDEGELDVLNSLHRYSYVANNPINTTDPSGETNSVEVGVAGNAEGGLSSAAMPTFQYEIRKFLIGNPKSGDFGLIGDLILDACMGSVDGAISNGKGLTKQGKGTLAHTLLRREVELLNAWLAKGSITKNISLDAEISMDGGKPSRLVSYGAAGSYRVDIIVYYKGRAAVAFDLKTGKGVQKGIGVRGMTNAKRLEYQRRFRTRMYTIGVEIP
jgi:hypothetical protein